MREREWATVALAALARGESVQVRPRGTSMRGKIEDGALVALAPAPPTSSPSAMSCWRGCGAGCSSCTKCSVKSRGECLSAPQRGARTGGCRPTTSSVAWSRSTPLVGPRSRPNQALHLTRPRSSFPAAPCASLLRSGVAAGQVSLIDYEAVCRSSWAIGVFCFSLWGSSVLALRGLLRQHYPRPRPHDGFRSIRRICRPQQREDRTRLSEVTGAPNGYRARPHLSDPPRRPFVRPRSATPQCRCPRPSFELTRTGPLVCHRLNASLPQ